MNNCYQLLRTITQAFTAGIAQMIVFLIFTPCSITQSDVSQKRVTLISRATNLG